MAFRLFCPLGHVISQADFVLVHHFCHHVLSVVRLSSLTFHIFYFFSATAEWNSTKVDRKQDLNITYQVCVFGPIGIPIWPPWPLISWDIFDFFPETAEWNSMTGSKILTYPNKFVFFGWSVFQYSRPGIWLVVTFSTSSLKPFNGIQRILTGSNVL